MSKFPDFPAWGYTKDEAKIFEDGPLPDGWYRSPELIPNDVKPVRAGRK